MIGGGDVGGVGGDCGGEFCSKCVRFAHGFRNFMQGEALLNDAGSSLFWSCVSALGFTAQQLLMPDTTQKYALYARPCLAILCDITLMRHEGLCLYKSKAP